MDCRHDNQEMTQVFYAPPDNISEETVILTDEEAHHACIVMRLEAGESIMVVDGQGTGYQTTIEKIGKRRVECRVTLRIPDFGEPCHHVTLAAGLSTGFKFDEVIQRGTELGVSRFIPMVSEKSKVRIDDEKRLRTKLERWNKVAVASMKQTNRSLLPAIDSITEFGAVLSQANHIATRLLFDPAHAEGNIQDLKIDSRENSVILIVGPEAGFSAEEAELAGGKGCHILSLGKRILRTENASPVAVALVMNLLGELR